MGNIDSFTSLNRVPKQTTEVSKTYELVNV